MMQEKARELEEERKAQGSDTDSSADEDKAYRDDLDEKKDQFLDRENFDHYKEVKKAKANAKITKKSHI